MDVGRQVGTVARGIRCPIIRENDDLVEIVVESILKASQQHNFEIDDHDVVGVTESILARAQGNYVTLDTIAEDVKNKFGSDTIAIVFPILSRNRFSSILQAFARASKKIVLLFNLPADEVGNPIVDLDSFYASGINPYTDLLSLSEFRESFGETKHPFTNMDYINYYEEIVRSEGGDCEIYFSNRPEAVLEYADNILAADVHNNKRTIELLEKAGAKNVLSLQDFVTESLSGEGYNELYGLLGANRATDESIKLFPRDGEAFVNNVQHKIYTLTNKQVEVMVYGDGAFKDPIGKIWELADPTVAPYYTQGLNGTPNEIKLKYLADNQFHNLSDEDLNEAIAKEIREKELNNNEDAKQGTTPRRLVDLIGSLCDLTSGSGDKGTPIVYIKGYFDTFADE